MIGFSKSKFKRPRHYIQQGLDAKLVMTSIRYHMSCSRSRLSLRPSCQPFYTRGRLRRLTAAAMGNSCCDGVNEALLAKSAVLTKALYDFQLRADWNVSQQCPLEFLRPSHDGSCSPFSVSLVQAETEFVKARKLKSKNPHDFVDFITLKPPYSFLIFFDGSDKMHQGVPVGGLGASCRIWG